LSGNPLDQLTKALTGMKTGITIAEKIEAITKHFKPYKPEIKSFRINYLTLSSEMKYLLEVSSGILRKTHGKVEVPVMYGFKIYDVIDLDTGGLVKVDFDQEGMKWVCNLGEFPKSERFMVTVQGHVGQDFLNRLVAVKAAINPKRKEGSDIYWIHSALKDVSILERAWSELNIDSVNVNVRIGVERFFGSAIPDEVKKGLQIQQKLLMAIKRGERNIEGLKRRYRKTELASGASPSDVYELVRRLVSGEFFTDYVNVDHPFVIGGIKPERKVTSIIPEKVKVGALADLNFRRPAVEGNLIFDRKQYVESVSQEISKFKKKPKKAKKKATKTRKERMT